jgi:hypothetical protein
MTASARRLLLAALVPFLCSALAAPALGEVAADRVDDKRLALIIIAGTITDGIDPIPQESWRELRPAAANSDALNPTGEFRGDGRPDFAWERVSGWPTAVWAYSDGTEHDIALAQWQSNAWGPVEFVTASTADERDPRVALAPDGTLHVTWWIEDGGGTVLLATREAGATGWGPPVVVSLPGEAARRPAVVVEGPLRVAYERVSAVDGTAVDLVVRRRTAEGAFVVEHVASAGWEGPLDPQLHAVESHLWLDWKDAPDKFCHAELVSGAWAQAGARPWNDPSWPGQEAARKAIAREVLSDLDADASESTSPQ